MNFSIFYSIIKNIIKQNNKKNQNDKIIYLLDNPNIIDEIGASARKKIEKEYDWDKVIIPKYLTLYEDLINNELKD